MHLTLKFLGEVNEGRIEEINDALKLACLEKKVFKLEFSVIGTFGRPAKVLWLGSAKQNSELIALADSVEQILQELGFEKICAFLWDGQQEKFLLQTDIGYPEDELEIIRSCVAEDKEKFLELKTNRNCSL